MPNWLVKALGCIVGTARIVNFVVHWTATQPVTVILRVAALSNLSGGFTALKNKKVVF